MKTFERLTSPPDRRPRWVPMASVLAAVLALPLLLIAVFTRWGVLVVVVVALVVGLGTWVWRRGFVFVEIAAFLIHFDGVGFGPVRMGRFVAAVALAVLACKLLSGWRPPAVPVRHWAPIAMFGVWATASGLWSSETGSWLFAYGQLALGFAFFCIGGLLIESHRMVQQFLRAYWIGGMFGSAGGVFGLVVGIRAIGFGADPNFFGLLQATMIPLTVYYRRHATTVLAKHLYSLSLLAVLVGAAGAGSRSGLIGGSVAIVGTMVTRPGLSIARRGGVAIGAVFVAAFAFVVGFVMNPVNLQRGFADRGAGRLDTWNVTTALSQDQPIIGYGFGQLKGLIPPNLLLTPGSLKLNELRPEISAHNTWLDVQGDLGLIGLTLFVSMFAVAILGFARPRWLHLRELHSTLLVMMLPVLTGSFFLPLVNNKVAWSLIGLSALLQVPSARARWSGMLRAAEPKVSHSRSPALLEGPALPVLQGAPLRGERSEVRGEEVWERVPLARWDIRIDRRFRTLVVLGGVLVALLFSVISASQPATHSATAGLFVPQLDGSGRDRVRLDLQQVQGVITLAVSGAYAAELADLAGLDAPVPEIRDRLFATRPRMGMYVEVSYTSEDPDEVEAVSAHLVPALRNVYEGARESAIAQEEDNFRPIIPGESRIYRGPKFFEAYEEPMTSSESQNLVWTALVGFGTGALATASLLLARQRRPRVSPTDDYPEHIAMPVLGRLRLVGRRSRSDTDPLRHVLASIRDLGPPETVQRRFVVTSAGGESLTRRLAANLASDLVANGFRVVLVDGRPERPLLSLRLGGALRPGAREVSDGSLGIEQVMRRVNPLRLPRVGRRVLGPRAESLRFVPAGRWRRSGGRFGVAALEQLDRDVVVVVLGPPLLGDAPSEELLEWTDALILAAEVGRTTTDDLEDAAVKVQLFCDAPRGVVLLDT